MYSAYVIRLGLQYASDSLPFVHTSDMDLFYFLIIISNTTNGRDVNEVNQRNNSNLTSSSKV